MRASLRITMTASPTVAPTKSSQVTQQPYPNYKVIVLDDDVNTFQHVASCLMKYIPHMPSDRAWKLTNQVHYEGQAIVWVGPPLSASGSSLGSVLRRLLGWLKAQEASEAMLPP